jgi:hypothetical protein
MSYTNLKSLNNIDLSDKSFNGLFEFKSNAMLYLMNTADVPRIKEMYNPNKRTFTKLISFDKEIEDIVVPVVTYNIIEQIDQSFTMDQFDDKMLEFGHKLVEGMKGMREVPMEHRKDINYNVLFSVGFHKLLEYLSAEEKTQEAIMMNGFDHNLIDSINLVKWSVDNHTPLVEMDDEQLDGDDDLAPTDKIEVMPV